MTTEIDYKREMIMHRERATLLWIVGKDLLHALEEAKAELTKKELMDWTLSKQINAAIEQAKKTGME